MVGSGVDPRQNSLKPRLLTALLPMIYSLRLRLLEGKLHFHYISSQGNWFPDSSRALLYVRQPGDTNASHPGEEGGWLVRRLTKIWSYIYSWPWTRKDPGHTEHLREGCACSESMERFEWEKFKNVPVQPGKLVSVTSETDQYEYENWEDNEEK